MDRVRLNVGGQVKFFVYHLALSLLRAAKNMSGTYDMANEIEL